MTEWIAAVAAAVSVLVAVFAWKAADRSAAAAERVESIERDRWHRDLTPDLDIRLVQQNMNHWLLSVDLDGPEGLDDLDSITVEILDEKGVSHLPGPTGPTAEDLAQVIWGPLRLRPGVDGVAAPGRTTTVEGLGLGHRAVRALELSLRPAWDKDPINSWARRYLDHPLRLRIVCHKDGHKPWTLIREVPVPPGTRPAEHTSPAGSATA
ncbi:hypothetical protein ACFXPX_36675 [Kitasatospora sp. NPDC059146]|uniref:hypothetical protein n=1 Tax=unclassified Kitasatospora TaxID=2633591 RepID=UPI0036C10C19